MTICFDLNVADRRKHENELFHTYLKCLTDTKNVNMSYDMLMDDVKKAVLFIAFLNDFTTTLNFMTFPRRLIFLAVFYSRMNIYV